MQKFVLTATLFYGFTCHADTLTLTDALHNSKLTCQFEGNGNSTHYLQPIQLNIANSENRVYTIVIENGQQFISSNAALQNLVLTKREVIKLAPFQKRTVPLTAMCTEMSDAAPVSKVPYTPTTMANGRLLELTQLIEQKQYYDIAAQQAVWCLTNKAGIHSIDGFDESEVNMLQQAISRITGEAMPVRNAQPRSGYGRTVITDSLSGSFTYTVRVNSNVLIAMFDKRNIVVRELYRNNSEAPGKKNFDFAFDASVYTDEVYYVRLLINGEKQLEGTVRNVD